MGGGGLNGDFWAGDHFGRCFSYIGFGGSGKSSSRVEAKEPVAEASGPMYCGL